MLTVVVVGVVVGGGLELRLSPCATEELDAVDVASCALAVMSLGALGFEELVFESIPVARLWATFKCSFSLLHNFVISVGAYAVSKECNRERKKGRGRLTCGTREHTHIGNKTEER